MTSLVNSTLYWESREIPGDKILPINVFSEWKFTLKERT